MADKSIMKAAVAALASLAAIAAAVALAVSGPQPQPAAAAEPARAHVTVEVVAPGATDHTTRAVVELYRGGEKLAEADVAAQGARSDDGTGGVEFQVGEGTYTVRIAQVPYDRDGGAFAGDRAWHFAVDADGQRLSHAFVLDKRDPASMTDAALAAARAALEAAGIAYEPPEGPAWVDGWSETWSAPEAYSYPPDVQAWASADGTTWATREDAQAHFEETGAGYESTVVRGVPELERGAAAWTAVHPGHYEDEE